MTTVIPNDVVVERRVATTLSGPLGVALLTPRAPTTHTVVVAMGYASGLDKFELQRFRLLCHVLQARLVVPETPGYGSVASRLSARERWCLLTRRDLHPVAERMLDAAASLAPELADLRRPVMAMGYSLGASTAAVMAGQLAERRGAPVSGLVLVEPVGARRWKALSLAKAAKEEEALVDEALAQTATVDGSVGPWDRMAEVVPPYRRVVDMLLLANALRAGKLASEVVASRAAQLSLVCGDKSRLCSERDVAAIGGAARNGGAHVSECVMPGTHGLWHSLPAVDRLAQWIASTLQTRR